MMIFSADLRSNGFDQLSADDLAGVSGGTYPGATLPGPPGCPGVVPAAPVIGGTVDSLQNAWAYIGRATMRRSV